MWQLQLSDRIQLSKKHSYLLQLALLSVLVHVVVVCCMIVSTVVRTDVVHIKRSESAPIVLSPIPQPPVKRLALQSKPKLQPRAAQSKPVCKKVPIAKTPTKKSTPQKKVAQRIKKPVEKKQVVASKSKPTPKPQPKPVAHATAKPDFIPTGTNVRVITAQELHGLQLEHTIVHGIKKVWSCPVQAPAGTRCTMVVTVGAQGNVVQVEQKKSSGIIAYDASVRQALHAYCFPSEVRNKKIELEF